MITKRKPIFISAIVLLTLILSACGGGSKKIDISKNNNNDVNANENENAKDANEDENTNENDEPAVDYEATSSALAETATAIAVVQNEPTAVPPTDVPPSTDVPAPTSPPPTDLPPTSSASSGFSEDGYVYFTDFDVYEEEEEAWYVFTVGGSTNYEAYVDSGYLTAYLGAANETLYIINNYIDMDRGDADVVVEIGFDNIGDIRTNNISVVCRYTDNSWYEFSLGSDGLWYMWKYQNGYELLANGGISGYDWKVTAHMLTAACVGDYLTFAIDGVIPRGAEVTNSSLREGGVGFSISTFDNGGVEVEFDYFYVEYVE